MDGRLGRFDWMNPLSKLEPLRSADFQWTKLWHQRWWFFVVVLQILHYHQPMKKIP